MFGYRVKGTPLAPHSHFGRNHSKFGLDPPLDKGRLINTRLGGSDMPQPQDRQPYLVLGRLVLGASCVGQQADRMTRVRTV
jgi:hypothetical protein